MAIRLNPLILVHNRIWLARPKHKKRPRGRPPKFHTSISLNIFYDYIYRSWQDVDE